jgi:glycosyltransferase involved in cell wall biosynthesis
MGSLKKLNVLLIPPQKWQPARDTHVVGTAPSEGLIDRLLIEHHDINVTLLDPNSIPLNPLERFHPIYRGIDPVRALTVLTKYRNFDLVLAVFESSALLPLLLRRLFGFRPKIVIWDIAPDEHWRIRQFVQNLVVPRVDRLFLLSSSQVGYIEKRWKVKDVSNVIWQHVDTDFFKPEKVNSTGAVLAIGDDHGRDWPTLLTAVSDMDIDLVIKTKKELDFSDIKRCRIHQIRDRISYSELKKLYAECNFVVMPLMSTLNVSGVSSVLEAMSMGKALVISDNPPIRDYIEPGETCKVVPVGDAIQLRRAMEDLLSNPLLVEQMGNKARSRAIRLYSEPVFAERLAMNIRQVVDDE